ncbi:PREDICTED: uncharacterized protein LOC101299546 [Fragaria vesca subsp. vesca]
MLQTGDIVEELRIGTSVTVKSSFKNCRSGVQKILHASFKAKDTSIQVKVRRGRDDFTELQACIVPIPMTPPGKRCTCSGPFSTPTTSSGSGEVFASLRETKEGA